MRSQESTNRILSNVAKFRARIQLTHPELESEDDEGETRWELPMADVMALPAGEFKLALDNLEDDNMHPESIILLAKRSGDEKYVSEAETLLAEQIKAGELTTPLYERRKALYMKVREYAHPS